MSAFAARFIMKLRIFLGQFRTADVPPLNDVRQARLRNPSHELLSDSSFQKNPRVCKIRVRNSGAGNGCANFMDAWKNALFLQEKPMSIKFLVLGGGVFWVFFGRGECRF